MNNLIISQGTHIQKRERIFLENTFKTKLNSLNSSQGTRLQEKLFSRKTFSRKTNSLLGK